LWAEQLIAESTGKNGVGILPIADEPPADNAQAYGSDRVFLYVRNADAPDAGHDSRVQALAAAGHPTITLEAHGVQDLGRLFFVLEFATAVAGWVLEINPFDQPDVQEAKDNTAKALEENTPQTAEATDAELKDLIARLAPPLYLAIMGYLPYSDEVDAAVSRLRAAVRDATGAATTFGYGPRFLHSTGQFHKGGPATGVFLQLTDDVAGDVDIPSEGLSFGRIVAAQADGDLRTLRARDLPAARVRLSGENTAAAIDDLARRLV
jgi:hypothetical protein